MPGGQTLKGRYEIKELLGQGGMGVVYRAWDSVVRRDVAVKALSDISDPEAVRRFLEECAIIAKLSHPNLIEIFDLGEVEEGERRYPFYVMPLLAGATLDRLLRRERLSVERVVDIVCQACRGLQAAHDKGLVHRDIKPSNLFILEDNSVRIIDFGIAQRSGQAVSEAAGTLLYMAPESLGSKPPEYLLGNPLSAASDIYSLAVVCYEALTGRRPFEGASDAARIAAILQAAPVPAAELNPEVSEPISRAVARGMARQAAERYRSAREFAEALQGALRGEASGTGRWPVPDTGKPQAPAGPGRYPADRPTAVPVSAGPEPTGKRPRSWRSPKRLTLWLTAAVAIALVAGFLILAAARTGPPDTLHFPLAGLAFGSWIWIAALMAGAAGAIALWRRRRKAAEEKPPAVATPGLSPSDGGTVVFRTAPGSASGPPPAPPPSRWSGAGLPGPSGERSDATLIYSFDKAPGGPASPVPPPARPDVAFTVTASANLAAIGRRFEASRFPLRIGRAGCELDLSFDAAVSRHHAQVEMAGGGFLIRDLGSHNGTFVNGKRLRPDQPEPLLFGTHVLVGSNTQLTFVAPQFEELPDLSGALIAGRYTLCEKLSSSAKSIAYSATDNKLPQTVVLKILSPRLAGHPGYREQFEQEAKMACRLRHPHISRVLDYGETELGPGGGHRALFIALEYLEGGSLAQRLGRGERFELDRVAGWLEKFAHALDYVHSRDVVHGGIKPTAIVFDAHDNPCLTDFAIAVTAEDKAHRAVIGSPAFLAPEQWEGGELVPATDQYAAAATFYLIVTGVRPHEGQEHPPIRARNFLRGAVPAHEMAAQNQRPGVPAGVSEVLARALAVNPAERYPSMGAFAEAFRNAVREGSERASRPVRVFLSYHRAVSSAWALLIKNELERGHGCKVFVDTEQRDTLGHFPRTLERNIELCDAFVCLLAAGTLDSAWVNREIELAHAAQKPMVPVFQESFRIPKDLSGLPQHVQEMLLYSGVKLLDQQNAYVDAAIRSVALCVSQSVQDRGRAAGFSG